MSKAHPFTGAISGWHYPSAKAKGTDSDWEPATYKPLVDSILDAFAGYDWRTYGPLGPRGVGYILLGAYIDGRPVIKELPKGATGPGKGNAHLKAEWTFADIQRTVVGMRRAGMLSWEAVEDPRTESQEFLITDDLKASVRDHARSVSLDKFAAQHREVRLVIEAEGGLAFWGVAAASWGMTVHATKGVSASRFPYDLAQAARAKPLHLLLAGDLDNDGMRVMDVLHADVTAHLDGDPDGLVTWSRFAVTEDQATTLGLATTTAKPRAGKGAVGKLPFFCQLEALTATHPAHARALLDAEVEAVIDGGLLSAAEAAWAAERAEVVAAVGAI